MASRSYVLRVNDPPALYRYGFFPRSFSYKKDAVAMAKLVIEQGASMARVECPGGGELDFRPEPKKKGGK